MTNASIRTYKPDKSLISFDLIKEAQSIIDNYRERTPSLHHSDNQIDFLLLKSHMFNTYNFFLEIDLGFPTQKLIKLKNELDNAYNHYKKNKDELLNPNNNKIESLLLKYSENFKALKEKISQNILEIKKLDSIIHGMETRISNLQEKSNSIKKLRGDLVDQIHYRSTLMEENKIYDDFIQHHKKETFPTIVEMLRKENEIFLQEFKIKLNETAFLFEQELWISAKNSMPIKYFFEKSNINGSPSLFTRLMYIDKNTPTTTAGNIKIKNELERIKKMHQKKVFLINGTRKNASDQERSKKQIIEKTIQDFDMYFVLEEMTPSMLYQTHNEKASFIFLHIETLIDHPNIIRHSENIASRRNIILLCNSTALPSRFKEIIGRYKRFGIEYFIDVAMSDLAIKMAVTKLLEESKCEMSESAFL